MSEWHTAWSRHFGPDYVQTLRDALCRAGIDASDATTFEVVRLLAKGLGVQVGEVP